MAKGAKRAKKGKRERKEYRFEASSTVPPALALAMGGLGAVLMGMGVQGRVLVSLPENLEPYTHAQWLVAAGALLLAACIWFGTSGNPALRVGDGGILVEKAGRARMPWHGIESISLDDAALHVVAVDEDGAKQDFSLPRKAYAKGLAYLVEQARARIPAQISVPDSADLGSVEALGHPLPLPPLQIAGRTCAATQKTFTHITDAVVCHRCERLFDRGALPETCLCGGPLTRDDA